MAVFKLPKAKKLPSGNWRIQFQIDGERYSVTGESPTDAKEKADKKARDILAGKEKERNIPFTVDKAIEKYIEAKKGILSPSTIKGYNACRKNYLQSIKNIKLKDLTQEDIQIAVSIDAINGKSPKTIRNAHGLLSAVLDIYRPGMRLNTTLPQKKKYEARIFTEEEMQKVWKASIGNKYALPILFASWLGLRMSEIRGLKFSDIENGRIHIQRAIVAGENGDVVKGTKTTSGDRWIKLPDTLINAISIVFSDRYGSDEAKMDNYICPYDDNAIYKNFISICKEAGVKPCRFHDLRHFAASEAMTLGVPDKYSIKRFGHKTDNMLKTVYQHTMKEREDYFSDVIDEKMQDLYKKAQSKEEMK